MDSIEKYYGPIRFVMKAGILILIILYIVYFIKFGVDFSQTNMPPVKMILIGLSRPVLVIIIFIIIHFYAEDFDLKLIGLPIGFAVGGTAVGLIGGMQQGITGWVLGTLIGATIIKFTLRFYIKQNRP